MQYLGLIVVLKLTVRLVMQTESEIDFYICYVD